MKYLKILMLSGILIGLASAIQMPKAEAAGSTKPTGITISPAFQQVSVSADKAEQPLSFSITNDKSTIQTLKLTTSDFNTLGETGGLFFVGANPTDLQKKYGLIKWLQLPYTELSLNPGQTVTVGAKILNQPDLSPGGHYGAINISAESNLGALATNINIRPIASTLLFVTKLGGDTHRLSLASVSAHHNLLSLPTNVNLRFSNVGNTHLIPRGIVKVLDPKGKVVSQGVINQSSDIVLPQTIRVYNVPLSNLGSASVPGKYKLSVDFRFDGLDQFRGYQQGFYHLPTWTLALPLALVCLLIFVVRSKNLRRLIHK